MLDSRNLRVSAAACPFCGPSVFVRLNATEAGVRCIRCAASVVHLSIGYALREVVGDICHGDVCEFSAAGPLVDFLRRSARSFSGSEYQPELPAGASRNGVRNEDVQHLTYSDECFDLITHTEVMEHVPDDAAAFAELFRVLRPGGMMLFTVPLSSHHDTIERARLADGQIEHLLDPVYHLDPFRGGSGVLAYRDYGTDIVGRLQHAGFERIEIVVPRCRVRWAGIRPVIVAQRAGHDSTHA
ncbi:MAG: class I SAM-dependent methyltransferase [Xanthomonadales bacterium]|nr:class I SAM-dependent methyltransferase [Xanthomonadales bacterium]